MNKGQNAIAYNKAIGTEEEMYEMIADKGGVLVDEQDNYKTFEFDDGSKIVYDTEGHQLWLDQ